MARLPARWRRPGILQTSSVLPCSPVVPTTTTDSAAGRELLTPREVSARLRVHLNTVLLLLHRGARGGIYPAYRVGRAWRVPQASVEAFLRRSIPQ